MKPVRQQMDEWRAVFEQSFREHKFSLTSYPVIDLNDGLIHQESPICLEREGDILPAGVFLPWINRLEMSLDLDKHVVDLALRQIADKGEPVCINLSGAAVVERSFLTWLSERLSSHPDAACNMWIEIPESMAFRHLEAFKQLASRAKKYQCKIGIEHVGHQLAELGQLHDVGVDYLKVDASFVRDIDNNTANQTLLRTLCTVGHSIGLIVIAEGVSSDDEWATLQELGADGAAGPGIKLPEG